MTHQVIYAFLITLAAGLATGIGSVIAFMTKRTNRRFLAFSLGLSAGVMIYVSFMEMLYSARIELEAMRGEQQGALIAAAAFFGGMLIAYLIDRAVPEAENPHELHNVEEMRGEDNQHHNHAANKKLRHAGIFSAIVLAIHNFPEGIATFAAAYSDISTGVAIAIAVAIHNIPEGIAVSVPVFHATGSRRKALWYSMLSGLAEPLGAMVAWLILTPFITPLLLHCIMAAVAGIMIYISFDELLPAAHYYGESHTSILGLFVGMAIMAVSLVML